MEISTINIIIGGFITSIIGGVVGGLIVRWNMSFHFSKTELENKRQYRNQKLESLLASIDQIVESSGNIIRNVESSQQFATIEERESFFSSCQNVILQAGNNFQVIEVYAPDLLPVYTKLYNSVIFAAGSGIIYQHEQLIHPKLKKVRLNVLNDAATFRKNIHYYIHKDAVANS